MDKLTQQQYEDLRQLTRLTDDEGHVDNANLENALFNRLVQMTGLVEFYDAAPYLTVKGYRLMIEHLEAKQE